MSRFDISYSFYWLPKYVISFNEWKNKETIKVKLLDTNNSTSCVTFERTPILETNCILLSKSNILPVLGWKTKIDQNYPDY